MGWTRTESAFDVGPGETPLDSQLEWLSHYLSFYLRHAGPEMGGGVSRAGWARIKDMLLAANRYNSHRPCTVADVVRVIQAPRKRRFIVATCNGVATHARAFHGHSVARSKDGKDLKLDLMRRCRRRPTRA